MTAPSIGRIVHYTLSAQDVDTIACRRSASGRYLAEHLESVQILVGNPVREGDVFPMMIVRVWEASMPLVQGQVFLDGSDTLWVTSITEGTEPGTYAWPPRV